MHDKKNIKTIHTKLSFYLILIAGIVEFTIGIRYVFSTESFDQTFGAISILEAIFAFFGLWLPDVLLYRQFHLKPKEFRPLEVSTTFMRSIIILATLVLIQFLFQFVPMTVRKYDKALAIAFAGPAEEALFRGLIITMFIVVGMDSTKYVITKKVAISAIEVFGIILSAVLFTVLHRNYYSMPNLLMAIFFSGIALAFFYWYPKWRDLTACILAHFALNMWTVFQSIVMVTF